MFVTRDYLMTLENRQPLTVVFFRQEDIFKYLERHPSDFEDKKFHELLIGWILAQFMSETERMTMHIGFPVKKEKADSILKMKITLEWLLENGEEIIEDCETDICIGNKDLYVRFQVTRFVNPKGGVPAIRLADLIKNKCRMYAANPELHLLVSMESTPNITREELMNLLTEISIPFVGIILLAKHSDELGHFQYIQLHPQPKIGKDIIVPLNV